MLNNQLSLFSIPKQKLPPKLKSLSLSPRKLHRASRHQIQVISVSIDDIIPADHQVRAVWAYVESLDLSKTFEKINTYEGCVGRGATDPKILLALWLYATVDGVGSARALARLVNEHLAYKWICGGVKIKRKTISDFRTKQSALFDDILVQGVAILISAGQVTLEELAQDGLRTRADVSKSSFHRKKSIKKSYQEAREHVKKLKEEIKDDSNKLIARKTENKLRLAEERVQKLKAAQANLTKMLKEKDKACKTNKKKPITKKQKSKMRASTTDPEARKMKMPDGSFHGAYNFQFVVDTAKTIIVGVNVVQAGSDAGQILPMYNQIKERYGVIPQRYLADGGFKNKPNVEALAKDGCLVYMPPQKTSKGKPVGKKESQEVKEWRSRMTTEESKIIYKKRASTIELANARLRRYGLYRICVKGLQKAKGIACMFAIAHNMIRTLALA